MSKVLRGTNINDNVSLEREANVLGARNSQKDLLHATYMANNKPTGDEFFQQNFGPLNKQEKVNKGIPILNSLKDIEGPNSPVTQNFSNYLSNVSGQSCFPSQARVFVAP